MATTNYLKVHRRFRPSVELFFDAHNAVSVASVHRAANEIAREMTEHATAVAAKPDEVEPTAVVVWTHGVAGLGDLHCIGGCDICCPRPDLEIVENENEEATT